MIHLTREGPVIAQKPERVSPDDPAQNDINSRFSEIRRMEDDVERLMQLDNHVWSIRAGLWLGREN